LNSTAVAVPGRWSEAKSREWYARQPWLVGANYIPADASNQLEMWQAETFNPELIDRELSLAESVGMNTMRVFLHDLLWAQDAKGFLERIEQYLSVASRHRISTMFVLFDSCWRPESRLGAQPAPIPGVHNSQWLQNPGNAALVDPSQEPRLKDYVQGIVETFGKDDRVVIWDLWNEPGNLNGDRFSELPHKRELVSELLPKVFAWARSSDPQQPLTSGPWMVAEGGVDKDFADDPLYEIQMTNSDVFSFHSYEPASKFKDRIVAFGASRPLLATEYLARNQGSTFQAILPIAKEAKVGVYNWGFVAGKTQTNLPWDSWRTPYVERQPDLWFHDVFHTDGRPYSEEEVSFLREITSSP